MSKKDSKIETPKNDEYYTTKLLRINYDQIGELIDHVYKNLHGIIISITNSPNPNFKDIIIRYKKTGTD